MIGSDQTIRRGLLAPLISSVITRNVRDKESGDAKSLRPGWPPCPSGSPSAGPTVSAWAAAQPARPSRQWADSDKCFPMTEELQNPLTLVWCWHVVSDSSC